MKLLTMLASLSLIASASQAIGKGDDVGWSLPPLRNIRRTVFSAKCGNDRGSRPRDRSIITLAALIARNHTVEMPSI